MKADTVSFDTDALVAQIQQLLTDHLVTISNSQVSGAVDVSRFSELISTIAALTKDVETKSTRINKLESIIETLEARIKTLGGETEVLKQETQRFKCENSSHIQRLTEANDKMMVMDTSLANYKAEAALHGLKHESVKAELKVLTQEKMVLEVRQTS